MGDVYALQDGEVSRRGTVALHALGDAVTKAVAQAKECNVPQGLIVAVLHALALEQTMALLSAPDAH